MLKKALLIFALLLSFSTAAQDVEVINHKGTKVKIANNRVTTANTAPTSPAPFKGDIWIDNTDSQNLVTYLWDGNLWHTIENQESKTVILNTDTEKLLKTSSTIFYNLPITNAEKQTINNGYYSLSGNLSTKIKILKTGNYLISAGISVKNMPSGTTKFILAVFQNNNRIGYLSRGVVGLPNADYWGTTGTLMYRLNANDVINIKYLINRGNNSLKSNSLNIGITKI